MATLRKRTRRLKNGPAAYWVVDYSISESGRVRRRQLHFRVDPSNPERARLLAQDRKAEIERKLARRKLRGDALDNGPVDLETADWLDGFCRAIRPNCSEHYFKIVILTLEKFRMLLCEHGVVSTAQLRRQHFSDFVVAMQEKGNKPKSIHNDLSLIKRAVQWGIDEGWLDAGQLRAFPHVRVPKSRRRALSKSEVDQLVEAARETDLYEPTMLALYTGGRCGELVQLRGSDIDLDRGVIRFRAEIAKSSEHGDVPIHQRLRPLLEAKAGRDGYLVTRRDGQPWDSNYLSRRFSVFAKERLGWNGVTFHILRHTFGTLLAASGKISPFELQKLMRHKDIKTSMIYVNLAEQELPRIDVF